MDDLKAWIRYREGELARSEADRFERRLRDDAALRARLEGLDEIAGALREGEETSFGPSFAARVIARLGPSASPAPAESMYEALSWLVPRLAAACLVVMLGIGVYSVLLGDYAGSVLEAVLGLPEATLATAFTIGG